MRRRRGVALNAFTEIAALNLNVIFSHCRRGERGNIKFLENVDFSWKSFFNPIS